MRKPGRREFQKRKRGAPQAESKPRPARDDVLRVSGLAAVTALFERAPERVERLFFVPDMGRAVGRHCARLAQLHKPYRQVDTAELARIAGTAMHGGVVAVARPRPILPLDVEEARDWAPTVPLLLVLDGIGNPHNLGAILRTAAFFGLDRLVISDHPAQAGISDAVCRVAEGGVESVQLFRARDLPATLRAMSGAYRVVGTALGRGRKLETLPRDRPLAVVLGNEERGLDLATLAACNEIVTIPGSGWVQSLNVAATAAVLVYDLLRTRASLKRS
jgi:RNA methyltransferase, TrmH family